ncbi:M1 family metallopeptidase [Anditalea andensis]|uniref:Peptidase M1 n=1 Tax=Anditalea andensis TaxID=1048983 RepID=A0A074KVN1_9BACT|nr:M1 family metallopeptidase [Anditalea andensis]KEO73004.1 peptidase M1 [Anditalea andensis]
MKHFSFLLIAFLIASSVFGQDQQNWTWGGPIDPLQARYEVQRYTLSLAFFPDTQEIHGSNLVEIACDGRLDTLRLNLINRYTVHKVEIYEEEVNFDHKNDILDIYIPDGCATEAKIYYGGKTPVANNPPWSGGFTWEKDESGNHWMGLSSQNEGAKIFMPVKDHPSSEPSNGVDLYLTAPSPYFIASNGRLVNTVQEDDKTTYHWSTNYPINNYNINFTLGMLYKEEMTYTSIEGNSIPMMVFVLDENKDKAPLLLSVLENSTRTHESYFGEFPFPLDKIAVVETPYLGMEHQTINGYGNNFQFVRMGETWYDWLLHHELGHEWWGNKVSVNDWAHFWIHEGFTAYGDWLYFLKHAGEAAYREKANSEKKNIKHKQTLVAHHNATAEEAYHGEIYTKGAYVVHSLRFILGDEVFFPMLKAITSEEGFIYENSITTKGLIDFIEKYSRMDLKEFFNLYLYTTEIPEVKINKKGRERYEISITPINLPVEIKTSTGTERMILTKKPVTIKSGSTPIIDPNDWYMLKK